MHQPLFVRTEDQKFHLYCADVYIVNQVKHILEYYHGKPVKRFLGIKKLTTLGDKNLGGMISSPNLASRKKNSKDSLQRSLTPEPFSGGKESTKRSLIPFGSRLLGRDKSSTEGDPFE